MPFFNKYLRLPDKGIEISSVKCIPIPETRFPESLFGYCAYALDVYECILKHDEIYIRFLSEFKQLPGNALFIIAPASSTMFLTIF